LPGIAAGERVDGNVDLTRAANGGTKPKKARRILRMPKPFAPGHKMPCAHYQAHVDCTLQIVARARVLARAAGLPPKFARVAASSPTVSPAPAADSAAMTA
jgi:hypothetical protein